MRRELTFRAPLDAAGLLGFFAARAVPGVEEVRGGTYRRVVRLAHGLAVVALDVSGAGVRLELDDGADARDGDEAVAVARRLLDLDADPGAVDAVLGADPLLAPLVAASPAAASREPRTPSRSPSARSSGSRSRSPRRGPWRGASRRRAGLP